MQITQFTDYSLRVLIYLARLPEQSMSTIAEITEYFQISQHHLVKVVNNLSNNGFITATRGKGGGIQLSRPASDINIGDVFRQTEANVNLMECFDDSMNHCRISPDCSLKGMMYEARAAFIAVLDSYTLADAAKANPQRVRAENFLNQA